MAKKLTSAKAKEILHDKSVHGHPLTDKQRRFFGAIAGGAKPYQDGGWLDKYEQGGMVLKQKTKDNYDMKPNANVSQVSFPPGFVGMGNNLKGRNYSPAWGGQFQDGGNLMPPMAGSPQALPLMQMGGNVLPGAAGFMYARTINPAPSNGPYAKKTKASAQNGKKVSYSQWKKQYNLKETPDYNLKRAWELGYTPDKTGHLPTVDNQTGQFLKAKGHPTLQLELDWYNSPEAADFRSKNAIDSSGKFFRYVPKGQNGQEMKYYQEGLDFTPKTISQDGSRTPTYVSDPKDRRLTRYNDSLTLYNNYIRTKAAFDTALGNSSSPKVQVNIKPAKDLSYIRNRNRFEMPDSSSTVSPLLPEEAVTAPQRETRFEGRKVSRPQVGTVNFPRHEPYFSTSIDPINIIEYNRDPGYLVESKDYEGDISSIEKNTLDDFKDIKNPKERAAKLKQYPYTLIPNKSNYYTYIEEYAKPIQPVVYKPDVKSYTLPTPKEPTLPKLYKYDPNTPTKFSFTYPTGGYNEQKTMYFPSKTALKSFTEGVRGATYQEGKDYASATGTLQDGGDIPVDPMGYWNPDNVGNPVIIPSTDITMEGVDQPLIGISDTGDVQYMEPGEDYEFDGEYVTEYPVAKKGISVNNADAQPLKKLDQLFNFTNYNKPTKGGWLDKYN